MSARKPLAALALTGVGTALVVGFQVPEAPSRDLAGSALSALGSGSALVDGTYLGAAVPEPWGTFQVRATIAGGKLTGVELVQAPGDGHSSRINASVVPTLTEAAIATQGAAIDLVSGATWTSQSYATSLQAALDAARPATGVLARG